MKFSNFINEDNKNQKEIDKLYDYMAKNFPYFKNMSMDRQGEIMVAIQKMISK